MYHYNTHTVVEVTFVVTKFLLSSLLSSLLSKKVNEKNIGKVY